MESTFANVCFLVAAVGSSFLDAHLSQVGLHALCVCCKGVRMALSSLTDAYATGGVAAADPVGPCATQRSKPARRSSKREYSVSSTGAPIVCLLFVPHILVEDDGRSRARHPNDLGEFDVAANLSEN